MHGLLRRANQWSLNHLGAHLVIVVMTFITLLLMAAGVQLPSLINCLTPALS